MRILISSCRLAQRTGSELFTWELAKALQSRGHEIAVYSPVCGDLAEKMREDGLEVSEALESLEFEPEVLHCQHHMTAMAMLARFRDIPAIYQCHGGMPWEEWPPVHPRILRYAGSTEIFRQEFEQKHGIDPKLFHEVPLSINVANYSFQASGGREAKSALVLSNYLKDGPEVAAMRDACESHGMTLDTVGWRFGNVTDNVPEILPRYDLVFAAGRSALEAMASGCAIIPLLGGLIDVPVREENFEEFAHYNFSIRVGKQKPVNRKSVLEALGALSSPAERKTISKWIHKGHGTERAVSALESAYRDLAATTLVQVDEAPFMHAYLEKIAGRVLQADAEFRRLREGWGRTKEKYELLKERLR